MDYSIKRYEGLILTIKENYIRLGTQVIPEKVDRELSLDPKELFEFPEGEFIWDLKYHNSVCIDSLGTKVTVSNCHPLYIITSRDKVTGSFDVKTSPSSFKLHWDEVLKIIDEIGMGNSDSKSIVTSSYIHDKLNTSNNRDRIIDIIESNFSGDIMYKLYYVGHQHRYVCNGYVLDISSPFGKIDFRRSMIDINTSDYKSVNMDQIIKLINKF